MQMDARTVLKSGRAQLRWRLIRITASEYKRRNITVWNEIAPRYHKRWAGADIGPFQSTDKLIEQLDVKNGNILDVACGTGAVTEKMARRVDDSNYIIGIDMSATAINIAKRLNRQWHNVHFVNADAENFGFAKKFDAVTCQYALFFFPNAARALRNMRRSLKRAGRLGITVHGRNVPFFTSILDAVEKFIPDYALPGGPALNRYGTKHALRKEVERVGFSKISIKSVTFRYSPGVFESYWRSYIRYVARPLRERLDRLDMGQRRQLKEMVRQNTKPYTKRSRVIDFPWEVLILTAEK